jgi:Ca2+-binding EF-hand superfamily protein
VANKTKLAEHFDMIDADKNGQLSKDELKNHHKNKSQNQSQNKN